MVEHLTMGQKLEFLKKARGDLLKIHEITQSIATVNPITDDDTMTVRRVKEMAQLINKLTEKA